MTKGERIKYRREQLGISQTELAEYIGTSKQNLYKYENDIITNIPSDRVEALAKRLNASPAYIMGWSDNPSPAEEPSTAPQLLPDERQLLSDYRNFNEEGQEKVRDYVEDLKDSPKYKKCSAPCMEKQA